MVWRIGELLVQKKFISWLQLEEALEEQKSNKHYIGEILIQKGFVSRSILYKALAEQHNMKFIQLNRTHINPDAVKKIPRSIAEKFLLMPVEAIEEMLIIAVSNPLTLWPQQEIKALAQVNAIQCVLALPEDITRAITENYQTEKTSA